MRYRIFSSFSFSFFLVVASLGSADKLEADGFSLFLSKLVRKEQRLSRPWRKLFIGKGTGLEGFWKRSIFQSFGGKGFELPLTLFVLPPSLLFLYQDKVSRDGRDPFIF